MEWSFLHFSGGSGLGAICGGEVGVDALTQYRAHLFRRGKRHDPRNESVLDEGVCKLPVLR